jgi:hypothetical protein
MNNQITTTSIGRGIVQVAEDFILSEEPMSRLVFKAQIHGGGIRGQLVRQRRETSDDVWQSDKAIDIRSLGKNETINIDINTQALALLYKAIQQLASILEQQGIRYGETQFRIVDPNSIVISDENKIEFIKKILDAGYIEDIWSQIKDSDLNLATTLSYARIQEKREKVVEELKSRLSREYSETNGDDSWQTWIYQNNWLFGANYQEPIAKARINLLGIMPDYLFPTVDDFIDILEIKLPTEDVIVQDTSHAGSWYWSKATTIAVGQVVNYLNEIDRLCLEIEREIKIKYERDVSVLKPRAYILIGTTTGWDKIKKEALRKLNHSLHGIEVLTYNHLIQRGESYIKIKN